MAESKHPDSDPHAEVADMIAAMRTCAAQAEAAALTREKQRIEATMGEKHDHLALRLQILRLKHARFQRIYDKLSLTIILVSSASALLESFKAELKFNDKTVTPAGVYHFLQLLPVATSTVTGFIAALLKFKKFAERMEAIGRIMERTVSCMVRQKRMADAAAATSSLAELDAIANGIAEVAEETAATNTAIQSVLKFADIVQHLPKYHEMALTYLRSVREFNDRTRGLVRDGVQVPDGPRLRRVSPLEEPATLTRRWSDAVCRCFCRRHRNMSSPIEERQQ